MTQFDRDRRFSAKVLEAFNARALPAMLDVKQATDTSAAEILLYDEIGPYGITSKAFNTALMSAGDGPLTIRINSPGGDVFDGLALHNAIKSRTSRTECIVMGLAASCASLIAMACNSIQMHDASLMMIHNSHTVAIGDKRVMESTKAILGKVDDQLAGIYASRTGTSVDTIKNMMNDETWLTSEEACLQGFADIVILMDEDTQTEAPQATAQISIRAAVVPDQCASAVGLITDAIGSLSEAIESLVVPDPINDPEPDDGADPLDTDEMAMQLKVRREQRLRLVACV